MWSNMFNPDKPRTEKPVDWKRIAALFIPYRWQETQVIISIFVGSLLGLLPPIFTMLIIDKAIPNKDFNQLCIYAGGMALSALAAGFVGVYQGYLNALVGEGIMRDIHTKLVAHLHRMPLDFFTSTKTGEIMNRVSNDVDSIDGVVTGTLVTVLSNLIMIVTTIVTILVLDWKLALLSLALIPLMILPIWPIGRRMYEIRKKTRQKRDEVSSVTQETLSVSGVTLIKSFVREAFERDRFFKVVSELMELEIQLAMIGRWFLMIIMSMIVIGPAIVWALGGWLTMQGHLTVGVVVTFVALLARLYGPASALAGIQVQIVSALAVFERIFDYLDMKEETTDVLPPPALVSEETDQIEGSGENDGSEGAEGTAAILDIAAGGDVKFENVEFTYPNGRKALNNISFQVKPGQVAAFVGHSGAGKTTITHLVPRFYDPESGKITIDDVEIRSVQLQELRKHIGIVTQETYLFHDTIGNNLRYGRQDATQDEIAAAARAANIHDFIESLPEKYDTVVGERGHKLSGGERQRLAIARVLLKDPRILILDEATSSLDSLNESLIQASLVPLMRGRTSLVIAHRLSTIVSADVIFVVHGGTIIESGTHTELLEKNQLYAELYRQQFRDTNAKAEIS